MTNRLLPQERQDILTAIDIIQRAIDGNVKSPVSRGYAKFLLTNISYFIMQGLES